MEVPLLKLKLYSRLSAVWFSSGLHQVINIEKINSLRFENLETVLIDGLVCMLYIISNLAYTNKPLIHTFWIGFFRTISLMIPVASCFFENLPDGIYFKEMNVHDLQQAGVIFLAMSFLEGVNRGIGRSIKHLPK